jgi:hypothetical protein
MHHTEDGRVRADAQGPQVVASVLVDLQTETGRNIGKIVLIRRAACRHVPLEQYCRTGSSSRSGIKRCCGDIYPNRVARIHRPASDVFVTPIDRSKAIHPVI